MGMKYSIKFWGNDDNIIVGANVYTNDSGANAVVSGHYAYQIIDKPEVKFKTMTKDQERPVYFTKFMRPWWYIGMKPSTYIADENYENAFGTVQALAYAVFLEIFAVNPSASASASLVWFNIKITYYIKAYHRQTTGERETDDSKGLPVEMYIEDHNDEEIVEIVKDVTTTTPIVPSPPLQVKNTLVRVR